MPNRRLVSLFLVILLAAGLYACQQKDATQAQALVRVDGRVVTLEQFERDLEKSLPADQSVSDEERSEMKRSFLVQVIDRELALAEADRLGLTVSPQEEDAAFQEYRRDYPENTFDQMLGNRGITLEDWKRELRDGLLMEKVLKEAVYSRVEVSDEEISAYYDEYREEFDRPEQVRARQILVSSQEEGERVLGLLRQGEEFDIVARKHSLSPDAEEGGDLGFFSRGEMPAEFDAVVFSLAVGRISDLTQSSYGYHIFKVEEKRKAVRLKLDEVKDDIRQTLRTQKEERAYQQWLHELRGRAVIEVDWERL